MTNPTTLPTGETLVARLRAWPPIAAGIAIAIPCAVLVGWNFEIEPLKRVLPGFVAMNPVTALSFIALGIALAAIRLPAVARPCAALSGVAGLLVLLRYWTGWEWKLDAILFTEAAAKNLMAPTSAFDLVLVSIAMWLASAPAGRGTRAAQAFALGAALVSLLALTGYAYGVEKLYRLSTFIAMALPTAGNFFIVSSGVLCVRPGEGLMARITGGHAGGAMLRRTLPIAVAVPFLLGWIAARAHRAGILENAFAITLFAIAVIVFLVTMIWRGAKRLDEEDARRAHVEAQLRATQAGLEDTVRQRTADLQQAVAGIRDELRALGAAAGEVLASSSALAASATQTAKSVAETTVTVEEVRHTAQLATERAQRVAASAQQAAEISSAGTAATHATADDAARVREKIQSIGERMIQLTERNHAIAEIVSTVDELAEQSNLLAVNAAIEAAAAREQGKGFAVVAQEVKYLSDQSRQATKQVRAILHDIQQASDAAVLTTEQATKAVEASAAQAARAGESILDLGIRVGEAANVAAEIAAASQQQLTGVNQVALAMEQIKAASTDHAGAAHRLELAARDLHALGQRLKELAERHKI